MTQRMIFDSFYCDEHNLWHPEDYPCLRCKADEDKTHLTIIQTYERQMDDMQLETEKWKSRYEALVEVGDYLWFVAECQSICDERGVCECGLGNAGSAWESAKRVHMQQMPI